MSTPEPAKERSSGARALTPANVELDAAYATIDDLRHQLEQLRSQVLRVQGSSRRDEKRRATLERRLASSEARVRDLETSVSYRVGHALVVAAKSPALLLRWIAVRLVRVLVRVVPERSRRWLADRTPERWRRRIRRAARTAPSRPQRRPYPSGATQHQDLELGEPDDTSGGVLDAVRGHAPLVVFVLLPSEDDDVGGLLEGLRTLRASFEFVPVFVTQSDDFLPFRKARVAFEYIPSQSAWLEAGIPGSWQEYQDQRLLEILTDYDADDVLPVPSARDAVGAVTDLLAPLLVRRVVR